MEKETKEVGEETTVTFDYAVALGDMEFVVSSDCLLYTSCTSMTLRSSVAI